MTDTEEKKKEPTRSIINPFSNTNSQSQTAPINRVNPFAMPSTSTSSSASTTKTTNTTTQPIDNVNKFLSNAFSSFRLPQQHHDTKSPNAGGGNVFAQFLPPPKATSENTTIAKDNGNEKQLLKDTQEKEEVVEDPQTKQLNSYIVDTIAEADASMSSSLSETKPDEAAAAALIQELAMESPSPNPVDDKKTAVSTGTTPFGTTPTITPFDKPTAPLPSDLNKTATVTAINPFDNIKAFQKNASKRWMEGLKNIQDTVAETNILVAEAFGKDDKKNKLATLDESDTAVEPRLQIIIWKKSRSSSSWEKCKLALVDSTLFYYPVGNSSQPSGTFSLFLQEQQALVSIKPFISSTYSSPTPFGLTLQQPPQFQHEEWFLCFDCYKDMKLWCDTLINLVVDVSISKHVGNWSREEDEKETIQKKESMDLSQHENSKLDEEEIMTSTTAEPSIKLINWNILLSWANISLLLSSYCSYNSKSFYFIFILLNVIATSLRLYSDTLFTYAKPLLITVGIITEEKIIQKELVEEKQVKKEKKISLPLQPGFSTIPYSEDIAEEDRSKIQFMIPPSDLFQVRRHDYLKSKIKIPSMDSLYDLWKVDLLQCNKRVDHFSSHIKLPEEITISASDNKWTAPEVFMISLNFPTDQPTLTGSGDDSKGFLLVCYFHIKDSTKRILQKQYSSESCGDKELEETKESDPDKSVVNAVKLLDEWCKRSPTDAGFQSRFKLIPHGFNLEELGVPSYLCKYNDKPLLIKRQNVTGFYRQSNKALHSFDITFYPFPYIAKQAISYMHSSYKDKMDLSFAFVLEGRDAAELPEVILGSVRLKKQDFAKLEKYDDYVDE